MPIVATAGHVDHGKSTLVMALTGRDPDRWAEEKARGLTIDLGFGWADIGAGQAVGFVDVPGHERFMKNMLAGVGAVDVALFVVAADEGWMPQTEEHAAVLDSLDVRHGVIAMSRIDVTDADTIELATLDVHEHVAGLTLETWPVVPVSAPTGTGIAELKQALAHQLSQAGPPDNANRPRLWVDRSFLIAGAGLVVTGTLTGGSLVVSDELMLWPGQHKVRVRSLQSHESETDAVVPGTRTAVNLGGVDRSEVPRGAMLGKGDNFRSTDRFLAHLRPVRGLEDALSDRGSYHVHVGSGAWPAHVRFLEDAVEGERAAVITLATPLPLTYGDRLILRETGRRAVVAGGRVLEPAARHALGEMSAALMSLRRGVDGSAGERADALLGLRRQDSLARLSADSGGGRPRARITTTDSALADNAAAGFADSVVAAVGAYQDANPLRPGAPKASLATSIGLDPGLLTALIEADDRLVDDGATVRIVDFRASWGEVEQKEWLRVESQLRDAGLAVPRASQLAVDREFFHLLVRQGRLVRVADDLVFLPTQIDEITARTTDMPDDFTVSDFRTALGLSRRQAVPLLEWLDQQGWTSRRGNVRSVRRRSGPGASAAPLR